MFSMPWPLAKCNCKSLVVPLFSCTTFVPVTNQLLSKLRAHSLLPSCCTPATGLLLLLLLPGCKCLLTLNKGCIRIKGA